MDDPNTKVPDLGVLLAEIGYALADLDPNSRLLLVEMFLSDISEAKEQFDIDLINMSLGERRSAWLN
ncbi:hypothetical protein [Paremcibacter congregatus]|uniref:Uncharacterized protein n=1 Tax=Paremcibacter congregatus TaxID=2043170 RepID=A0A2G4YUL4_9PROT|nr:hypothetical protein [Paremcibacter congregatus]PHZ85940.1 hypothetical protein CRD36_04495 [Paremcibacter congregatus]QDE26905.1 hypothetical protein FIV45_06265 [Paremcibacter congregatus]|tara:strand:- start:171 stop:371 length:201 start_codon:yes stop_codon:yes gene_type:complete